MGKSVIDETINYIQELENAVKELSEENKSLKRLMSRDHEQNPSVSAVFDIFAEKINENTELRHEIMKVFGESAKEAEKNHASYSPETIYSHIVQLFGNDTAKKYLREYMNLNYVHSPRKK